MKRIITMLLFLSAMLCIIACSKKENKMENETQTTAFVLTPEFRYEKELFEIELKSDVEYKEGLALDIRLPKGDEIKNRPAIVFVHGGGLVKGDKANESIIKNLSIDFAKRGYVTFNVNYRLGKSANASTLEAAISDVNSAVKWISANANAYGADSENIIVCGYSSGAEIAVNLCYSSHINNELKKKIKAIVDISGGNLYYGMDRDYAPTCLIIHGTDDTTVSYNKSELFYGKVSEVNNKSELYPINGGSHNLDEHYETIKNKMSTFLYKELFQKE